MKSQSLRAAVFNAESVVRRFAFYYVLYFILPSVFCFFFAGGIGLAFLECRIYIIIIPIITITD